MKKLMLLAALGMTLTACSSSEPAGDVDETEVVEEYEDKVDEEATEQNAENSNDAVEEATE